MRTYYKYAYEKGVFRNLNDLAKASGCSPRVLDKVLRSQSVDVKTTEKIERTLRECLSGFGMSVTSIVSYSEEEAKTAYEWLKRSIPEWVGVLFDHVRQDSSGGLRGFIGDLSFRSAEQPWSSAQGLVALLKAREIPNMLPWRDETNRLKMVRRLVEYFSKSRSNRARVSGKPLGGGWTLYDQVRDFDVECITEINSWIVLAIGMTIGQEAKGSIWSDRGEERFVLGTLREYIPYILERQTPSGGWSPIDNAVDSNSRLYATVMAIWALGMAHKVLRNDIRLAGNIEAVIQKGLQWVIDARHNVYGWTYNTNSYITEHDRNPGLNAKTIFVLMELSSFGILNESIKRSLLEAQKDFLGSEQNLEATYSNLRRETPQDHFCLAGHDGPVHLEYSQFLGCPWSLAVASDLSRHPDLPLDIREQAEVFAKRLFIQVYLNASTAKPWRSGTFELAENLICIAHAMRD